MNKLLLSLTLLLSGSLLASAQGTLVFDQQSSTNWNGEAVGSIPITDQPLGQSFTPALSSIDFVRLRFSIPSFPLTAAGTVSVNLWSGGISNGFLLASSMSALISLTVPGSVVYTNLFFSSSVLLNPGTTYYLQPFVTAAAVGQFNEPLYLGSYGPRAYPATYPGGMAFINGIGNPNYDLWFREGIVVVPEPSPGRLAFVALLLWFLFSFRLKRLSQTNAVAGTDAPASK